MNSERLAIQLMIAQGVLFAAETAAIHQIGSRAPLMLLALIRAAAGWGSPSYSPDISALRSCARVNCHCNYCAAASACCTCGC